MMRSIYHGKVALVATWIEYGLLDTECGSRAETLAEVSQSIRRRAGNEQIDTAQLADGIRSAARRGIITKAEAKLL